MALLLEEHTGSTGSTNRAPKKHISKNKDRDIPYKPPYNEAQ